MNQSYSYCEFLQKQLLLCQYYNSKDCNERIKFMEKLNCNKNIHIIYNDQTKKPNNPKK